MEEIRSGKRVYDLGEGRADEVFFLKRETKSCSSIQAESGDGLAWLDSGGSIVKFLVEDLLVEKDYRTLVFGQFTVEIRVRDSVASVRIARKP